MVLNRGEYFTTKQTTHYSVHLDCIWYHPIQIDSIFEQHEFSKLILTDYYGTWWQSNIIIFRSWYWRKNEHGIIFKMRFLPGYYRMISKLTMLQEKYVNDMNFEIYWLWSWKLILPVYTTNKKLTWTGFTCNKLMRDY